MSNEPIKLVTTKSDKELAEELKREIVESTEAYLNACTKAHKAGFSVNAQFSPNYLGVYSIQHLSLTKSY